VVNVTLLIFIGLEEARLENIVHSVETAFKRVYTAFHNNVQNYAIEELRHKRAYGCRKKRLNTATFF